MAFRLGIYIFKDVEVIDFAAPYGVFAVARRFDPELDAFLIADAMRPVQAQAGFTALPNYGFNDQPWTLSSSPVASARGKSCTIGDCTITSVPSLLRVC